MEICSHAKQRNYMWAQEYRCVFQSGLLEIQNVDHKPNHLPFYRLIWGLCYIERQSQIMTYAVEMEAQSHDANVSNSAVISVTEAPIASGYKFTKTLSNIYTSSHEAGIWAILLCNTFSHS